MRLSFIGASRHVPFEATIRLFQKFRGHRQISLGRTQFNVSEVCAESGKKALHIGILSIPFGQAVNRERMPDAARGISGTHSP
jgi:hypothetical protein